MPQIPSNLRHIDALVDIVRSLRGPKGCPWDKKQTHESLVPYALEEVYELVEAIEIKNSDHMKEELGDNLLQIILHAQIASENHHFSIEDVISTISEKIIRRHPHVFSKKPSIPLPQKEEVPMTLEEIEQSWQSIKQQEKKSLDNAYYFKNSISKNMPALQRAFKIGKKTGELNFDWSKPEEVLPKIKEEYNELLEVFYTEEKEKKEHELGDLFFTLVQLTRHLDLDPETCLRKANIRFENRMEFMLESCGKNNKNFQILDNSEKENLWSLAKAKEKEKA